MDSFENVKETQLPSRESFYSKLNKTHISDRDYTQAKKVWEKVISRILENIMICILKLIYCYWLMCLKLLEQSVIIKIMDLTPFTITQPGVWLGVLC